MKTYIISVSPTQAEEWLQHNTCNRKINESLVNDYANDMKNGKWALTHQGLAFYENGDIADGQHRLKAVIKSGKTIMFLVAFGVQDDAKPNIDRNKPRSNLDSIKIGGLGDWINKQHISVINAIDSFYCSGSSKRVSVHKLVHYGNQIKQPLIDGCSLFLSHKRLINTAPVVSAVVLSLQNGTDFEKIKSFSCILNEGITKNNNEDVTVIKLREFLLSATSANNHYSSRFECHLKTQRAIQAFVSGQKLGKLMLPKEPIYSYKFTD